MKHLGKWLIKSLQSEVSPTTNMDTRALSACSCIYLACLQFVHAWDFKLVLDFASRRGMDTWHQKVTRTHFAHTINEVKITAASLEPWLPIDCFIAACGATHTAGDKITMHSYGACQGVQQWIGTIFQLNKTCLGILMWQCVWHKRSWSSVDLLCISRWWCNQQNVRISGGLNPKADQLSTTS